VCVGCGSTSRVLGVWVIQFSGSSLNFPDPTENRTSGSRFDAQPLSKASCAGPAPLDLGAPAPWLVGIVSTEVPSDPHTPGDFRYIMYHISFSDIIHLIYVFILSLDHGSWIMDHLLTPEEGSLTQTEIAQPGDGLVVVFHDLLGEVFHRDHTDTLIAIHQDQMTDILHQHLVHTGF